MCPLACAPQLIKPLIKFSLLSFFFFFLCFLFFLFAEKNLYHRVRCDNARHFDSLACSLLVIRMRQIAGEKKECRHSQLYYIFSISKLNIRAYQSWQKSLVKFFFPFCSVCIPTVGAGKCWSYAHKLLFLSIILFLVDVVYQ